MDKVYAVSIDQWLSVLRQLVKEYSLFAPTVFNGNQDYEMIDEDNAGGIIYNHPKPATPLKTFMLPVKENVTVKQSPGKKVIIMGIPSCDLAALGILDEMYLNNDYTDTYYKSRRENSILVGYDCHSMLENCHCTSYGIKPYPEKNADIQLATLDGKVFLESRSEKGELLIREIERHIQPEDAGKEDITRLQDKREQLTEALNQKNAWLPDYESSEKLIEESPGSIWSSYSSTCVSCGACATICPTCTCFLLVDRPGFEKVRQLDACQYPDFEKVAAGEDPLEELPLRFKNRYQCKYVWKPKKFKSIACTGCGRCIDACIGKISKNELLEELASYKKP